MTKSNQKKTALYCRLSQDDGNQGDSNSIQNQKAILMQYAKDHGFLNPVFYVDDGYSGANFNRPDFQRMITDMENGEISTIITKDLSRLGRNQLHTGLYIEERFPQFGVRYIAINDGVDTDSAESNDLMPFKNLFNEWYVRDSSRKVRAVLKSKAERGERIACRAPYGYMKDPMNKGKLLVDDEAASVVKRIFSMCASGLGPSQIAGVLSKENILCPAMYGFRKTGVKHPCLDFQYPTLWSQDTVAFMLENEVYIGNTISMKYASRSYKDKRKMNRSREECIVHENTHEAIIDRETWEIVQRIRQNKRRRTKTYEKSIFAGLLKCADCGKNLTFHRGKDNPYYNSFTCSSARLKKGAPCTGHFIRECVLNEVVLEDIRQVTQYAREQSEAFADYIRQKQYAEINGEKAVLEAELLSMRNRMKELDAIFMRLYEDSVMNRITTQQFQRLSASYTEEQARLETEIPKKEAQLREANHVDSGAEDFIHKAKRYTDITELTTEILQLFIEKIVVHEKEQRHSRYSPQTIEIYYNGIGCIGETASVQNKSA